MDLRYKIINLQNVYKLFVYAMIRFIINKQGKAKFGCNYFPVLAKLYITKITKWFNINSWLIYL